MWREIRNMPQPSHPLKTTANHVTKKTGNSLHSRSLFFFYFFFLSEKMTFVVAENIELLHSVYVANI